MAQTLVHNGVTYFLTPANPYYRSAKGKNLHRAIWEEAFGPIPLGHQIHHKDGNPLNNHLANLQIFSSRSEHLKHHRTPEVLTHHAAKISAWIKRTRTIERQCRWCGKSFIAIPIQYCCCQSHSSSYAQKRRRRIGGVAISN